MQLVAKLKDIAASKGVTPSQLALAWVHAQARLCTSFPTSVKSRQFVAMFTILACSCPHRLVLQGDDVFPIPGTKRVKYVEENIAAFHVKLTKEEVQRLSDLFHPDAVSGIALPCFCVHSASAFEGCSP